MAAAVVRIRIDDAGDVILSTPAKEAVPAQELLVSSKALSLASKPFRTMFGPHFMEGQALSVANPPALLLAEDDGYALSLLCQLLHHQDCQSVPDSGQFVGLLVLADKYDCVKAICGAVCHSLRAFTDRLRATQEVGYDLQPLLNFMICSYITKDSELFRILSWHLLQSSPRSISFTSAMSNPGAHLVPPSVWTHLGEQRHVVRTFFFTHIVERLQEDSAGTQLHEQIDFDHINDNFAAVDGLWDWVNDLHQLMPLLMKGEVDLYDLLDSLSRDLRAAALQFGQNDSPTEIHNKANELYIELHALQGRILGLCLECCVANKFPRGFNGRKPKCDHYESYDDAPFFRLDDD